MRFLFIACCLVLTLCLRAQQDSFGINQPDSISLIQAGDSTGDNLKEISNKEWEEKNLVGLKLLLQEQENHRQKEKARAIISIGIGVLFLGIFIIGLLRKRSKKTVS